jgi:hypothetical protein
VTGDGGVVLLPRALRCRRRGLRPASCGAYAIGGGLLGRRLGPFASGGLRLSQSCAGAVARRLASPLAQDRVAALEAPLLERLLAHPLSLAAGATGRAPHQSRRGGTQDVAYPLGLPGGPPGPTATWRASSSCASVFLVPVLRPRAPAWRRDPGRSRVPLRIPSSSRWIERAGVAPSTREVDCVGLTPLSSCSSPGLRRSEGEGGGHGGREARSRARMWTPR